ncbi:hypothetical protein [Methylobacterium oryzihabitans]|uniref:hypothetical protein n=1 Tax=Methylobacterium oryzihabitans TaxID=2499852 RepID=UPI00165274A7|nr:hypothetical protein [Methylobacterium oryzihabitans]
MADLDPNALACRRSPDRGAKHSPPTQKSGSDSFSMKSLHHVSDHVHAGNAAFIHGEQ